MGEDQDAAGARGLDEAQRGHGLARAGGVLEPEAAVGAGVLVGRRPRRPPPRPRPPGPSRRAPRPRRAVLVGATSSSSSTSSSLLESSSSSASSSSSSRLGAGQLLDLLGAWTRCAPTPGSPAVSAISVPDRASTWWAESVVPSARCGSSSASRRSRPEHQRVLAAPGRARARRGPPRSRPGRRRAPGGARCPRPSACAASSPSSTKGSRAKRSARLRSAPETGAAAAEEWLSATCGLSSDEESGRAASRA